MVDVWDKTLTARDVDSFRRDKVWRELELDIAASIRIFKSRMVENTDERERNISAGYIKALEWVLLLPMTKFGDIVTEDERQALEEDLNK